MLDGHKEREANYVALRVFDDEEDRTFDGGHFAVERAQTEPVLRRAEHQGPRVTFNQQ